MRRRFASLKKAWSPVSRALRDLAKRIRQSYRWVSSILFGSSTYGPWIRLLLFVFAFLIFLLAFFPLVDLLNRTLNFMFETLIPEVSNAARILWELLLKKGPPSPIPPGQPTISLPQPGLRESLRMVFTSQTFFDLAQRGILGIIPLGFSILFAAFYFQYLHNTQRFWPALVYMMRAVFPFPKPAIRISNGTVIQRVDQLPVHRFGGPAKIALDPNSAAVFERSNGEESILLAGLQSTIGAFEKLKEAVFLGEGEVEVNTNHPTKDGIRLVVKKARFRYSLYGIRGQPTERILIRPETIEKLVYGHWLGRDWEKPDKRNKGVHDLVKTELQDYISKHELVDFLGSIEGSDQLAAAGYNHLNPFNTFAQAFTRQAGHYSGEGSKAAMLRLTWTGEGEWLAPTDVSLNGQMETWKLWLEDKRRWEGRSMAAVKGEQWRQEVNQLLNQIPLQDIAGRMKSSGEIAGELMIAYREILNAIKQTEPALDPLLQEQLDTVLKQINRLIRSCDHRE